MNEIRHGAAGQTYTLYDVDVPDWTSGERAASPLRGLCGADLLTSSEMRVYCSRTPGHDGGHVAGTGRWLAFSWAV